MANNEPSMTTIPNSVIDGMERELAPTDPNVSKFAPAKYRAQSTLTQTTSDMRKVISEAQRAHDDYARQMKQHWDELLRLIG